MRNTYKIHTTKAYTSWWAFYVTHARKCIVTCGNPESPAATAELDGESVPVFSVRESGMLLHRLLVADSQQKHKYADLQQTMKIRCLGAEPSASKHWRARRKHGARRDAMGGIHYFQRRFSCERFPASAAAAFTQSTHVQPCLERCGRVCVCVCAEAACHGGAPGSDELGQEEQLELQRVEPGGRWDQPRPGRRGGASAAVLRPLTHTGS